MMINKTSDELKDIIKRCKNPMRKEILINLLKVRLQMEDDEELEDTMEISTRTDTVGLSQEVKKLLKDQKDSLEKISQIKKLQAYQELLQDNQKEDGMKMLAQKRGKGEMDWNNGNIYDPNYMKYMQEDHENNKMMGRLNDEIDFRSSGIKKGYIERPFNNATDATDTFARFDRDPEDDDDDRRYVPKKRKIGARKKINRR